MDFAGFQQFRFRGLWDLKDRVARHYNSRNRDEWKVEVSGEKGIVFGISGFEGQRGKALDNKIRELTKSGIPKGKGESPNVSWVLIVEFMPVQRSHENNSEGPVTYT